MHPSHPRAKRGQVSRRDLLTGAAGIALATFVPRHVLGGTGHMRFTNDENANRHLREEYHSGWSL